MALAPLVADRAGRERVKEEFRRQALTEEQFQTGLVDGTIQSADRVLEAMAAAASRA